jgi:hypothetical protein
MIDLDPAIVDQETLRKKRRKKLLLISLGPNIILVIAGLFFLRPAGTDVLYHMNFSGRNAGAVTVARIQQFANLIEPYIAYYDAGTALIQQGEGKEAEKEDTVLHGTDDLCTSVLYDRRYRGFSVCTKADGRGTGFGCT